MERTISTTGGQGDVFVARDRQTDERVAIKLYRGTPTSAYRDAVDRVRALDHPAIVSFLEIGTASGVPYEVMPFHASGSLADLIPPVAPLDAAGIRLLVEQLAGALSALHAAGIVHRDVKPSNVLVADERPLSLRLGDFGVAATGAESRGDRTRVGNLKYEAPEVYTGVYGPTVDWWGLGLIVLECIDGRSPFVGADGVDLSADEILNWMRWRPLPLPENLGAHSTLLLRGLLTKSPALRWGTTQIEEWLAGESPPEFFDEIVVVSDPLRHPARPFRFGDVDYTDRSALAAALLRERRAGERIVVGDELDELVGWAMLFDPTLARHLEAIAANIASGAWRSPLRALVEVVAAIDRTAEPRLSGSRVDTAQLREWARAAAGSDSGTAEIVADLARSRALLGFAVLAGAESLAGIDTRWHAILAEVEMARGELPAEVDDLVDEAAPRLTALALLVALDPAYGAALLERTRADVAVHPAAREGWFRALAAGLGDSDAATGVATALVVEAVRDEAEEMEYRERIRLIEEAADRLRREPEADRQPRYRAIRRSRGASRGRTADRLDLVLHVGVVIGVAGLLVSVLRLPFDGALAAAGVSGGPTLPARWAAALDVPEPVEVLGGTWVSIYETWAAMPWAGLDLLVAAPGLIALLSGVLTAVAAGGRLALRRYRYYRDARAAAWLRPVAAAAILTGCAVLVTLPWQALLLPATVTAVVLAIRRRGAARA